MLRDPGVETDIFRYGFPTLVPEARSACDRHTRTEVSRMSPDREDGSDIRISLEHAECSGWMRVTVSRRAVA